MPRILKVIKTKMEILHSQLNKLSMIILFFTFRG